MLELKHVYTRYGKVECLKGITISVNEGEIVALLGANGAGKTTVLKTISGLIHPVAGEILFQGKLISSRIEPQFGTIHGLGHHQEDEPLWTIDDAQNDSQSGFRSS